MISVPPGHHFLKQSLFSRRFPEFGNQPVHLAVQEPGPRPADVPGVSLVIEGEGPAARKLVFFQDQNLSTFPGQKSGDAEAGDSASDNDRVKLFSN